MKYLHQDASGAPRGVTHTRDEQASAIEGVAGALRNDVAKSASSAVARAALLGIEAYSIGPDTRMLRHAHDACIGVVYGPDALVAAVAGFEAVAQDVSQMVRRVGL